MLNNGSKESKRKMGEELTGAVSVEQSGRQNFGQYQTEENIKVDGLFQLGAVQQNQTLILVHQKSILFETGDIIYR